MDEGKNEVLIDDASANEFLPQPIEYSYKKVSCKKAAAIRNEGKKNNPDDCLSQVYIAETPKNLLINLKRFVVHRHNSETRMEKLNTRVVY